MNTPTPWRIGKHGSIVTDTPDRQVEIIGEHAKDTIEYYGGHVICETVTDDNAAFIINACNTIEASEAQRDELAAQLQAVTAERNRFADELAARGYKPRCTCAMDDNMHESQCAITGWVRLRFERTAPVDWRDAYQGETPLGIALDGMGDEVEP